MRSRVDRIQVTSGGLYWSRPKFVLVTSYVYVRWRFRLRYHRGGQRVPGGRVRSRVWGASLSLSPSLSLFLPPSLPPTHTLSLSHTLTLTLSLSDRPKQKVDKLPGGASRAQAETARVIQGRP